MRSGHVASEAVHKRYSEQEARDIRKQVERILASPQFRASRRCHLLLQYVCECALKEDQEPIKERTLGVAVFGRAPDYDTNQDPVVRTTAGEIRKKLAQYYQEPGHEREIRTSLLPGSYMPEFGVPAPILEPIPEPIPQQVHKSPIPGIVAVVLGLAVLACSAWFAFSARAPSHLAEFWRPVLTSPGGVLICLGQTPVYVFSSEKTEMEMRQQSNTSTISELQARSLVAVPDRYIALGDGLSFGRLAAFLEKNGAAYIVRGSPFTTFSDLRDHAAILVGAFNNEWTIRLLDPLRFHFEKDTSNPAHYVARVVDRQRPEHPDWKLINSWPAWNISHDYAIVSRILDAATDRITVTVAGITHFGTIAAGEFLTKSEYFDEAAPMLPGGWQNKNVQIVIEVPVVKGAVGRPKVLAAYAW